MGHNSNSKFKKHYNFDKMGCKCTVELLESVSIKVVDSGGWPKRLQRFHAALHYNQYTIFFPLANTTRLTSPAQKIINVSI